MNDEEAALLAAAIDTYLRNKPRGDVLASPFGDDVPIPTPAETELLATLIRLSPISPETAATARLRVAQGNAYDLRMFAMRMALLAARTHSPETLHAGALGLALDADQIDYRDIIVALSILQDAAWRLDVDLRDAHTDATNVATDSRRNQLAAWLRRRPEHQGLMSMAAQGDGKDLIYTPWP